MERTQDRRVEKTRRLLEGALLAALRERQREARSRGSGPDERLFAFSRHLLAHAFEHRDIFPAMSSKRGGALIQQLMRNLLLKVVREDVKAMTLQARNQSAPLEASAQFIAGGLFGLLMWWLSGKMRLSVEEVDGAFRRLAIPALKAAAR